MNHLRAVLDTFLKISILSRFNGSTPPFSIRSENIHSKQPSLHISSSFRSNFPHVVSIKLGGVGSLRLAARISSTVVAHRSAIVVAPSSTTMTKVSENRSPSNVEHTGTELLHWRSQMSSLRSRWCSLRRQISSSFLRSWHRRDQRHFIQPAGSEAVGPSSSLTCISSFSSNKRLEKKFEGEVLFARHGFSGTGSISLVAGSGGDLWSSSSFPVVAFRSEI